MVERAPLSRNLPRSSAVIPRTRRRRHHWHLSVAQGHRLLIKPSLRCFVSPPVLFPARRIRLPLPSQPPFGATALAYFSPPPSFALHRLPGRPASVQDPAVPSI